MLSSGVGFQFIRLSVLYNALATPPSTADKNKVYKCCAGAAQQQQLQQLQQFQRTLQQQPHIINNISRNLHMDTCGRGCFGK